MVFVFFFVKQKTAYEMRISDWSSDVCSSDLIILVRPDLGQIEGIEVVGGGIGLRHHLHAQGPARKVAGIDGTQQVALMALAIGADQGGGLGVGQILDALLAAEVELDPEPLVDRKSTRLNSSH